MKNIFYLLVMLIVSSAIVVNAQDDKTFFQRALDDARTIEPNEIEPLQMINNKISVVTLTDSDCSEYQKNENYFSGKSFWVTLTKEMKEFYQSKSTGNENEFVNKESRLKKLLGLRYDITYKCVVELEVDICKLNRPTDFFDLQGNQTERVTKTIKNKKKDYPFTNLGYTCDWFYGDGCRKGLNEFFIKESNYSVITKACAVDDYFDDSKCKELNKQ